MTIALSPVVQPEPYPGRKIWTREECEQLERYGFLEGRYELIDGEIILKVGQKQPHALTLSRIMFYLMGFFGPDKVQTQTFIEVASSDRTTNYPEPDILVLEKANRTVDADIPAASDVVLLVEIADTTLRTDLTAKATLYARAGVREYWVMDVRGRQLVCHRDPTENGYAFVQTYTEHETITPLAAPDHEIAISEFLPLTKNSSAEVNH